MTVTSFAADMARNIPLLGVNRVGTGLSGIGWTQVWGKLSVFKPVYGKWEKELARARRATSEAGGWAAFLLTEKVLDNFTESGVGKYVKLFFPCCLKNNPSFKSRYPPFTLSMLKWQLATGNWPSVDDIRKLTFIFLHHDSTGSNSVNISSLCPKALWGQTNWNVRFGAEKGLLLGHIRRWGGSSPKKPKVPKGFQQSIFKRQVGHGGVGGHRVKVHNSLTSWWWGNRVMSQELSLSVLRLQEVCGYMHMVIK